MTEKDFWNLIEKSKKHGEDQVEWLQNELIKKTTDEIVEFELVFKRKMKQSYSSSLWGAAYVIMGGCSDDGFEYFRGWLIAQGEDIFNKVLIDAEFLAEIHLKEETELEEMLYVASRAYTYLKTGDFSYDDGSNTEFSNALEARGFELKPANIEFDWEEDDLEERYPILWRRFG
jgi:hypothetical protein